MQNKRRKFELMDVSHRYAKGGPLISYEHNYESILRRINGEDKSYALCTPTRFRRTSFGNYYSYKPAVSAKISPPGI